MEKKDSAQLFAAIVAEGMTTFAQRRVSRFIAFADCGPIDDLATCRTKFYRSVHAAMIHILTACRVFHELFPFTLRPIGFAVTLGTCGLSTLTEILCPCFD